MIAQAGGRGAKVKYLNMENTEMVDVDDLVVSIPVNAAFGQVPVELRAAAGDGGGDVHEFELIAYSGGALRLEHPSGAEIVLDLAGASATAGERSLLLYHDAGKPLGRGSITIDAAGKRVAMKGNLDGPDDRIQEILDPVRRGLRWSAVVSARLGQIEFVPAGEVAEVNGGKREGPVYICRRAEFCGASVTALSSDGDQDLRILAAGSPGLAGSLYRAWLDAKSKPAAALRLRDKWHAEASGRGTSADADGLSIFFEAWLQAQHVDPSKLRAAERRVLMAEWSRQTELLEAQRQRGLAAAQSEVDDDLDDAIDDDDEDEDDRDDNGTHPDYDDDDADDDEADEDQE